MKKILPRCGACHRYVLTWVHKLIVALLALTAFFGLLALLKVI